MVLPRRTSTSPLSALGLLPGILSLTFFFSLEKESRELMPMPGQCKWWCNGGQLAVALEEVLCWQSVRTARARCIVGLAGGRCERKLAEVTICAKRPPGYVALVYIRLEFFAVQAF